MQNLATELDLVPEEAVAVLRGVKIITLRNERSRGVGPPFVKLGNEIYYLKPGLKELVKANTVTPSEVPTLISGPPHRRTRAVARS